MCITLHATSLNVRHEAEVKGRPESSDLCKFLSYHIIINTEALIEIVIDPTLRWLRLMTGYFEDNGEYKLLTKYITLCYFSFKSYFQIHAVKHHQILVDWQRHTDVDVDDLQHPWCNVMRCFWLSSCLFQRMCVVTVTVRVPVTYIESVTGVTSRLLLCSVTQFYTPI